jgi:hypothetical protein
VNAAGFMAAFVLEHAWLWPLCEILHFIGLTLMVGSVALFDLRVLGLARGASFAGMHRFIRLGLAGFAINALTGAVFLAAMPALYLTNAAFQLKVIALLLMGCNLAWFYTREFPRLRLLGAQDVAPRSARLSAGVSLLLLVAVVCFGRFVAFYKFIPLFG